MVWNSGGIVSRDSPPIWWTNALIGLSHPMLWFARHGPKEVGHGRGRRQREWAPCDVAAWVYYHWPNDGSNKSITTRTWSKTVNSIAILQIKNDSHKKASRKRGKRSRRQRQQKGSFLLLLLAMPFRCVQSVQWITTYLCGGKKNNRYLECHLNVVNNG